MSTALLISPVLKFSEDSLKALDRSLPLFFNHRRKKVSSSVKMAVRKGDLSDPGGLGRFADSRPGALSVEDHVELALLLAPFWS